MPRRIIPISSGKGGVGKTTFAVNFALTLSRHAPTVLVDLDTGTSSVRSTVPGDVRQDLYHFKKKGVPLRDCISRLDHGLDPDGLYKNFGFIAGPRNFIREIANPDAAFRRQLAQEINRLPAEYVVLDLRAGLDENVLDFLPYSNSGILIFTPQHPAATLAASEIVKAILFRSLRILFGKGSAFYTLPRMERYYRFINDMLDRVEDVYEPLLPNLDAFLEELRGALGDHPILHVLAETLESFRVYYVLNMFNGVEEGYQRAVVPFVENLSRHVSSRLHLTQLGWVIADERIHRANCEGVPAVIERRQRDEPRPRSQVDPVMAELARLESAALGLRRRERPRPEPRRVAEAVPMRPNADLLEGQLQTLKAMYSDRTKDTVRENFSYVAYRAMNLMTASYGPNEFGTTQLAAPERLLDWYMSRQPA
ncbi:MAG TPA: P-loop NTPase [Thermoanaerobaculia bacterium]|nr:P-loop NTPase [Thermoanaerobaculia bacterium]